MPYSIKKVRNKYCVYNTETGERKGCSSSRKKAEAHRRVLYMRAHGVPEKEKEMGDQVEKSYDVEQKEIHGNLIVKNDDYVPYNVYTFEELDKAREAQTLVEDASDLTQDFVALAYNILNSSDLSDKASKIQGLAQSYAGRLKETDVKEAEDCEDCEDSLKQFDLSKAPDTFINRVAKAVKSLFLSKEEEEEYGDFVLYKEKDGTLRWIARYSNNFRDDDSPREIISAKSHQRFVDHVDKGIFLYPDLQIWHIEDFTIGKSDWVAYDDQGFALAAGQINKGCEDIAVHISKQKGVRLSHGMLKSSLKRDPEDNTVIIEHQTAEISLLPEHAAANKYTGFLLLENKSDKEDSMAIPDKKVEELRKHWALDDAMLNNLQRLNEEGAKEAFEEGRDSKEKSAVTEETSEAVADSAVVSATEATDENEKSSEENENVLPEQETQYAKISEVADAFANVMKPYIETTEKLVATVEAMSKEINELKQKGEQSLEKTILETPNASLGAILAQRMSAIGAASTNVDGRSSLAQKKPKEAPEGRASIGIPFIDEMLKS